jgi:hypothetical protein
VGSPVSSLTISARPVRISCSLKAIVCLLVSGTCGVRVVRGDAVVPAPPGGGDAT